MSEQAAMRQYVETLTNVDPGWQEAAAAASNGGPRQKQGGAGGPVFSTLRGPDTDQQQQVRRGLTGFLASNSNCSQHSTKAGWQGRQFVRQLLAWTPC
jgi:hypothetical protein